MGIQGECVHYRRGLLELKSGNICDKNLAGPGIWAAVDVYLSGVWSCFNTLQENLHSSWGVNTVFRGSAFGAWTAARCYISICDFYTVEGITGNAIHVSACVQRCDTACTIDIASWFLCCAEPQKISGCIWGKEYCDKTFLLLLHCLVCLRSCIIRLSYRCLDWNMCQTGVY